jgi:outer membrane biosynthesis protein TonB
MSPITGNAAEVARRGLLKISESTILSTVDGLDLRGHAKISAVVGIPLRNLQQRHDVATFAASAPIAAVTALLELLAMNTLEKVIAALGDHADTPNFEQLSGAIDTVQGEGASIDDVVAVLAFAVVEEFPAAPHCRRLFEERTDFALPELPDIAVTSTLLAPKETDPEIKEQRRRRREEEKKRKRGPSSQRPPRPTKSKPLPKTPTPTPEPRPSVENAVEARRPMIFTPAELDRFDPEHALAGTVVILDVPFDATDPSAPEQRSKERPALVVAASPDGLLVRPIYSSSGPSRHVLQAWRRLGLDHVCYVDDTRVALSVAASESLERVGRLTDQEWNAQL